MQPFLKWPGGKRWLISRLKGVFPQNYNNYFEPFLGGGSTFFHLTPQNAVIADINKDLINTYQVMAKNPIRLKTQLEIHQEQHCKQYYYHIREHILDDEIERAARFLYLNRTCYNGMYRVNQLGHFNVPIGTRQNFTEDTSCFEEYAAILKNASIRKQDFVDTIRGANRGDLIFADPPYTIAHNQNSFIKYNEKLFSWKDQKRLLTALIKARDKGAIIIATNAFYPTLKQMYEENQFYTQSISRFSSISGSIGGRGLQKELLITTYPIRL